METVPKVSVIVPVYNGEAHLRECLNSILNQTLQEMEILCVDDGSTDSSVDLLKEYREKDGRVRIYQQEHKYAGTARNLGKAHAAGEYLAFWDCDDFFAPKALELLYQKAVRVDADVCVCGGNQFLESKQACYPYPPYLRMKLVPEEDPFNRFTDPDFYLNFTNGAAWNKLFRRSYIERLHLDFQTVRNGNDVYFTECAIGLAERITVVNKKLINYRVNAGSGLVESLSRSPLTPIQAWMDIAETLQGQDGFGERSFANKAIGSMLYLLQNIREWDAFRQAIEALQSYALEKMHIFPRSDFYYSDWHASCVEHLYQDTPESFALFLAHSSYTREVELSAKKRGLNRELNRWKKENQSLKQELNGCTEENQSLKQELEEKKSPFFRFRKK